MSNWAAAQLAAAREDEELRARREAQDIDIPNTIPLFKCAPARRFECWCLTCAPCSSLT